MPALIFADAQHDVMLVASDLEPDQRGPIREEHHRLRIPLTDQVGGLDRDPGKPLAQEARGIQGPPPIRQATTSAHNRNGVID